MKRFLYTFLFLAESLFSTHISAQCVLSIANLPDTIRACRNTQVQLNASFSFNGGTPIITDTVWTPSSGLSATNVLNPTVTLGTTSASYLLTVTSITPFNSVVNGDFSNGNTGFSSEYTDTSGPGSLWPEAHYAVVTNPFSVHPNFASFGDHTTGTGNMMVINGAGSPVNIWCQTITVTPNTQYTFSAWGASCTPTFPAQLQFEINGNLLGTPLQLPTTTGQWVQFQTVWNSSSNTSITICIYDQQTALSGNDFAIDDIAFQQICVAQDSVYIQVNDLLPSINKVTKLGCKADTVILSAANSGTLPDNYTWTLGDGTSDSTANVTHTYSVQGQYNISLVESTTNGCRDTVTTSINTQHPISAGFTIDKLTACQDQAVNFTNTSVAGSQGGISPSYYWNFGDGGTSSSQNPSYTYSYSDTGTYKIMMVVNDFIPCYDTAYGIVQITSKPNHYPQQDTILCSPNNDVAMGMSVKNADTYLWNTGETTPTIIPKTGGMHIVAATNQCGSISDTINVTLFDCNKCLFVPNAFTPNNDGLNDRFHVRQICPIKYYGIKIFNRYGQMVYTNYNIDQGWDGTFNGVMLDGGTYFYEIEYTADVLNAQLVNMKGDLTLIR